MRKLISKIAGLMLGLSLAVGVGVAVGGSKAKVVSAAEATIDLTAQGFSNQQEVTTVTSGVFTLTFAKASGSNAPKYYTSGSSVRTYANNTLTVSTSGSENISQIVFTLGGTTTATPTANTGNYDSSSKTWTGSATSVTFTNAASGQYHYKTVAITTSGGGGGDTDPVLQSIAVSGEKTAYNVGDEFVKPTVTATYDKGEPQDVTSSATCTGYNMGVAGNYTVTVSYGGKTATYDITVVDPSSGEELYSATFTEVATHGYTQNKEFTLNGKDWLASVSQVNSGVFYLGCNSTHAAKGILNDNATFSDVVTALSAVDSPYASAISTAHAYAMRFSNAYENVGSVEFVWAGGNNAFQVYLFGDRGDGLVELASTNYSTSGAAVSGSVKWTASGYGENFSEFVIVARPGATGSTATSKTLRAATFKIYEGEVEPVDPSKKDMVIYTSGNPADGGSFYYSKNAGTHVFKAYEDETLLSDISWSVSDTTVATIDSSTGAVTTLKPGDVTIYAEAEGYNKASAAVHFIKGALEEIAVTGSMSKTSYTTNDSWSHGGLVATGTYHSGWSEDISDSAVWTYSPASPADGVTSVVATATLDEISGSSSAQSVSVTVAHAGTVDDPFTVAEGIAKCQEIGTTASGDWYVSGIISAITSTASDATTYHNATFNLSDDGENENFLIAYQVKYIGGADFTAENFTELKVGCAAVVHGALLNYKGNTPEFNGKGTSSLVSLEQPETGDVDVTFEPAQTSFEIGAKGTFTASSETQGVTYEWSVNHSEVLTVDSSTGEYQAVGLGSARVTVTASAGGKDGIAFVDFVVNGSASSYNSVPEANAIASDVASGHTTAYYIYVEGYVKEFATSMSGTSPRALDIMTLDETSSIMVYTNVNPYADFISGLSLGDRIVVKGKIQNYSGKYEIVEPEKVASNASAITFALNFISQTDSVCSEYDGVTDNGEALDAIWEGLHTSYNALYDNQKSVLMGAERNEKGTHVEQAVARYDYLVGKYKLDNFITGRTPVVFAESNFIVPGQANTNSSTIVIVVVALTSITSIGVLLVIKRKRSLIK